MCREAVLKELRNGASIGSWLGDSQLERYSVVSFPGTCYVQERALRAEKIAYR